jgi:ribosomal protection tetracycline resistance protein
VLSVLDGAVLVISAVEGVQPQTRILMRALRRLKVPVLIFVNKIDRRGAGYAEVLASIAERLTPAVIAMGTVTGPGGKTAGFRPYTGADDEFLAALADRLTSHDDELLADYVRDESAGPADQGRAGVSGVLRLGDHRGRSRLADGGNP